LKDFITKYGDAIRGQEMSHKKYMEEFISSLIHYARGRTARIEKKEMQFLIDDILLSNANLKE
jgi:hypothetical protein